MHDYHYFISAFMLTITHVKYCVDPLTRCS